MWGIRFVERLFAEKDPREDLNYPKPDIPPQIQFVGRGKLIWVYQNGTLKVEIPALAGAREHIVEIPRRPPNKPARLQVWGDVHFVSDSHGARYQWTPDDGPKPYLNFDPHPPRRK